MRFTLTYEGELKTGRNHTADRKHAIRKNFHKQLKRLWTVDNLLANWHIPVKNSRGSTAAVPANDWISSQVPSLGSYRFVPMVTELLAVECALEIRVLRPTHSAGHQPDVDNQIKVLMDALKVPRHKEELGKFIEPEADENPFFVLTHDDSLITKVSSVQDELLGPVSGKLEIDPADVRVFIDVAIRPRLPLASNVIFFSDHRDVWDNLYEKNAAPENLAKLSNRQLQATATQCIFRINALSEAHQFSRQSLPFATPEEWEADIKKSQKVFLTFQLLWQNDHWPRVRDIHDELCRRVYGDPPYPQNHRLSAIVTGALAGPYPLADAATELSTLTRQLQS